MFEMFDKVKRIVDELDEITSENHYVSNPFNRNKNKTYVWVEKQLNYRSVFKNNLNKQ